MSRRPRPVRVLNPSQFLNDATLMHKTVQGYAMNLRTDGDHYKAVSRLDQAILDAIETVTGSPAPWIFRSSTGVCGPVLGRDKPDERKGS